MGKYHTMTLLIVGILCFVFCLCCQSPPRPEQPQRRPQLLQATPQACQLVFVARNVSSLEHNQHTMIQLYARMHACIHTCTHACIHTYMHTFMPAYIHARMRAHKHTIHRYSKKT